MMQLICNGVRLDLPSGSGLQFTHDNPLFSFDKLSCERTTQFKLPRTETNDRVFALARVPAYDGVGMRRKFAAQLVDGTLVKDGYLYVGSWSGTEYNAVFVTGELVGLQRLRDLGNIGDYMHYTDVVQIGVDSKTGYTARQADERWANVYYSKPLAALFRPSIWLNKIYNDIITQEGITAPALPVPAERLWLISQAKGINQMVEFGVEILDPTQPDATQPTDPYNTATADSTIFDTAAVDYGIVDMDEDGQENKYFRVVQFRAKTDIVLEIPDNWDDHKYIFDFSFVHDDPDSGNFYGGRWFEAEDWTTQTQLTVHGESLRGRGVSIAAGECFSFVDSRYYLHFRTDPIPGIQPAYYTSGFFLQDTSEAEFADTYTITVKTDGDLRTGSICRLQDNLPEITFVELLKVFAAVTGKVLNYDEENGVTFDDLNFNMWAVVELKDITKRGTVQRTFADYAQRSIINYNSDESVATPITATYTIDNDNIAQETVLQTIPFNEGEQDLNFPMWVYIREGVNKETLGDDANGSASLWRVLLPKNTGLQTLCDASTQIQVEARLSLMEYNAITAKTIIQVEGTQYVWTTRSWQKDIAKFTLAKIQ